MAVFSLPLPRCNSLTVWAVYFSNSDLRRPIKEMTIDKAMSLGSLFPNSDLHRSIKDMTIDKAMPHFQNIELTRSYHLKENSQN